MVRLSCLRTLRVVVSILLVVRLSFMRCSMLVSVGLMGVGWYLVVMLIVFCLVPLFFVR